MLCCRLMELQQQMVGGEQANNEEVKRLHQKKKVFAEERKRKLQRMNIFICLYCNKKNQNLVGEI